MKLYSIQIPKSQTNNIVYNCPHSGEKFPDGFLKSIDIDEHILLSSGDSFVNQLFAKASIYGSVLLANEYSRSFIDTNREAYELDPSMFSGEITATLNSQSQKVRMGFGSIAKYAYTRNDIYNQKIPFKDAEARLDQYYFPIHEVLRNALLKKFEKFGYALLIDCHSMPSYEFLGNQFATKKQPDIILGNLHGNSCNPLITDFISQHFKNHDLTVALNVPFAGGYNTSQYCEPDKNRHAIQIEIKKSLYMDEIKRAPNQSFKKIKIVISSLCAALCKEIDNLI